MIQTIGDVGAYRGLKQKTAGWKEYDPSLDSLSIERDAQDGTVPAILEIALDLLAGRFYESRHCSDDDASRTETREYFLGPKSAEHVQETLQTLTNLAQTRWRELTEYASIEGFPQKTVAAAVRRNIDWALDEARPGIDVEFRPYAWESGVPQTHAQKQRDLENFGLVLTVAALYDQHIPGLRAQTVAKVNKLAHEGYLG